MEDIQTQVNNDQAYAIFGYIVVGLFGLWFLYLLRQWCTHKLNGVQSDANRALYATSMEAKVQPRYPIFAYFVSCFITVKGVEVDFVPMKNDEEIKPVKIQHSKSTSSAEPVKNMYSGEGAFLDSPAGFEDLEANFVKPSTRSNASETGSEAYSSPSAPSAFSEGGSLVSEESSLIASTVYSLPDYSSISDEGVFSDDSTHSNDLASSRKRSDSEYSMPCDSADDANNEFSDVNSDEEDALVGEESAHHSKDVPSSRSSSKVAFQYPGWDESTTVPSSDFRNGDRKKERIGIAGRVNLSQ